jgi:hypothetical protein
LCKAQKVAATARNRALRERGTGGSPFQRDSVPCRWVG